jgi:hypothetical protein
MNRLNQTLAAGALLCLVAGGAGGCRASDAEAAPTRSTPQTSSAAPSPTPTASKTKSVGNQDARAAEQAVITLWKTTDSLAQNPKARLDKLTTVARDDTVSNWTAILTDMRRQGLRQVGDAVVIKANASPAGERAWKVNACIDVSSVNVVDPKGKSTVAAGRAPRVIYANRVIKATNGKFYVVSDRAVGTC